VSTRYESWMIAIASPSFSALFIFSE